MQELSPLQFYCLAHTQVSSSALHIDLPHCLAHMQPRQHAGCAFCKPLAMMLEPRPAHQETLPAGIITCFSVSQAGRYMVSGCAVGTVKLWSLTEGMQLDMQPDAHPGGCSSLGFLEPSIVSHPDLLSLVFSCSTWHSHVAAHHRQQTTHTYILHSRQTPAQVLHEWPSSTSFIAPLACFMHAQKSQRPPVHSSCKQLALSQPTVD